MRFLRSLFGRLGGQRGQSVVEAVMAVAVLGIAAQATALVVQALVKQNVSNRDRIFATEKALQMLEELRALVLTDNATLTTLDTYTDGFCNTCAQPHPYYKWTLTTKIDITSNTTTSAPVPDWESAVDPHSANPQRPGGYAFVRYVDIISTTTDANVRMIYVRVYAAANNPGDVSSSQVATPLNPTAPPLAEVYGEVHSQGTVVTPDQVLDVYFVALESVPGWWSRTSNLIPLMQTSITNLQSMNDGLQIRQHWVHTMSFGRDLEYTPEVNAEGVRADTAGAFMKTYVYPGTVDFNWNNNTNASVTDPDYYYLPSWFLGRVNVAGAMPPGTGNSNSSPTTPWPSDMSSNLGYAIADQFNHAMRYPDEQNLYNILCTIAANKGVQAPEMSWRMLLEKLNDNDPSVQNAIIINLHGEMVPVPPLRNYSDAAKDPDYYWASNGSLAGLNGSRAFRAVSQPERLWYPQSLTQAVNVYAYDANPSEIATSVTWTPTVGDASPKEIVDTITLFVPHANTSNLYQIFRTQGNSLTPYYRFVSPTVAGNFSALTYYPSGVTVVTDAPAANANAGSTVGATFWADNYTPTGRTDVPGLRIRLFGTTPTARAYAGPEYSLTPSP
jgi:type II secretory pathway pseudopilin PulG